MRIILILLTFLGLSNSAFAGEAIDTGNTTWILVCSALVMLMTPGLAFFYAGMVNRKNVVSTLLQSYMALAVVGLLWICFGYSLAFGEGNAFIGDFSMMFLDGVPGAMFGGGVPLFAFVAFQMMFAIITAAIISGSIAERINFTAWIIFIAFWTLLVYSPVAHWVWGPNGWVAADGGLDFAGGLVVHITYGVAGLVAAVMLGRRSESHTESKPNDVSMVMLGAALLWFGWFGFNAGSALAADQLASHAFITTFAGASAAFIAWTLVDWFKHKKPSAVGGMIGIVVGLVTITPAAGFVSVKSAIIMCLISGVICNLVTRFMKSKTKLDDSLDVFACHGMGGILGAVLTGLFAETSVNSAVSVQGLLISGETGLLFANIEGIVAVTIFTAIVTFVLIKVIGMFTTFRISEQDEIVGLDKVIHGEVSRFNNTKKD